MYSKLRYERTRSFAARATSHSEFQDRIKSFTATILEARSFEYDRSESSSTLDYTRSETYAARIYLVRREQHICMHAILITNV